MKQLRSTLSLFVIMLLLGAVLAACTDDEGEGEGEVDVPAEVEEENEVVDVDEAVEEADVEAEEEVVEDEAAEEEVAEEGAVGIADVLEAPDEFVGQSVRVEGEAAEFIGEAGVTIVGDDADEGVLLIIGTPEVVPGALQAGAQLQARGVVETFDLAVIEEALGVDLEDEAFAEFEGQPVLVAEEIDRVVTAGDILRDPNVFLEHRARVTSPVAEVINPNVITFEAEGEESLVAVGPEGAFPEDLETGTEAEVAGFVREFNEAELEEELGIDIPDERAAEFEGQLVLVAEPQAQE